RPAYAAGIRVQGPAGQADGGFRAMVGLVQDQQRADVERLVDMAAQAREAGFDVLVQGGGDFDLLAACFDAHRKLLGLAQDTHSMSRKRPRAVNFPLSQPRRTRSCEEGMFMASRYLATVRRATGTPRALSVSARRASDSGLRGSSASTRARIIAWIAVLEASPPPAMSMPEAKKARSGRAPRGVRTYLRATARDTVDSCSPSVAATSRRVR